MTIDAEIAGREAMADYIETSLLVRGSTALGNQALIALAEEETGRSIAEITHSLGAMSARAAALGDAYPFEINAVMVRARPGAATMPYSALLQLTSASVARQLFYPGSTGEMEVAFENLASSALARLWGDQGRALRFGWPSEIGRPQDFPSAVSWLAETIGVKVGAGYRQPRRKDGGVDVVAWRPFPDKRSGFPILLAQCTLQADLLSKAADVDIRLWASWLALDAEPVTALVVPGMIRKTVEWDEIALRCMIFDRVRLAGLLGPHAEFAGSAWVVEALSKLSGVLQAAEA